MENQDLKSLFNSPGWETYKKELLEFLESDFEYLDEFLEDKKNDQ